MKKLIFIPIIFFLISCEIEEDPDSDSSKFLAYNYAQDYVKKELNDPKSAEWPGLSEQKDHVTHLGNWEFEIVSYVRAKNGFGSLVKTPWRCVLQFDREKETLTRKELKIGN